MNESCAYKTGFYPNLLAAQGMTHAQIQSRTEAVWQAMFGTDEKTAIYFSVGDDMGYVCDTGNDDARTEGMSYGMIMAVQLNHKEIFDRIWKWAKTYMYMDSGPNAGYFAWSVRPDGVKLSDGPAPDGEEYFAMALIFAAHRWGDGEPPYDYAKQAKSLLHACIHKGEDGIGTPMWDPQNHLIRFIPGVLFSDPSYHLPHFYMLFAENCDEQDRAFWLEAAAASRNYLQKCCHHATGLSPEYAEYDGSPRHLEGHGFFYSDAYRVALNIALDSVWFGREAWHTEQANAIQQFFSENGIGLDDFKIYEIDGSIAGEKALHPYGLLSTLAAASLAADGPHSKAFLKAFLNLPLRTDKSRYYDNCLYLFSLLALTGQYRIY